MNNCFRLLMLGCALFASPCCLAGETGRMVATSSAVPGSPFWLAQPVEGRRGMEVAAVAALVVLAAGQLRFGKPALRKPRRS